MAEEKKGAMPSIPRSHGQTEPKTAGMRPFDAAGQYGRKESAEQAARLPGLRPDVYKKEVTDYQEKLAEYNAKARGKSTESESTPVATDTTKRSRT